MRSDSRRFFVWTVLLAAGLLTWVYGPSDASAQSGDETPGGLEEQRDAPKKGSVRRNPFEEAVLNFFKAAPKTENLHAREEAVSPKGQDASQKKQDASHRIGAEEKENRSAPRGPKNRRAAQRLRNRRAAQATFFLNYLDVNGDGVIQRREFPARGHLAFQMLDLDGDGRLTRKEILGADAASSTREPKEASKKRGNRNPKQSKRNRPSDSERPDDQPAPDDPNPSPGI